MRHRGLAVLALLAITIQTSLVLPGRALAHCPGTQPPLGRAYASGHQDFAGFANGVRSRIDYTNPAVCANGAGNAFTAEGVTLCFDSDCTGWLQVGWTKRLGTDTAPVMYCEYKRTDSPARDFYFSLSAATHEYRWERASTQWNCMLDGASRFGTTSPNFTSGGFANAQGETNSTHAQLGRMAPAKLSYNSTQYRLNGVWNNMVLTLDAVSSPYGRDSLGAGSFRDWTNAH